MKQNFIYAPALKANEFRCKVPLQDTRQLFIVNGQVQGGASPFVLNLKEREVMEQMLQIISVRNADHIGELSCSSSFNFGPMSSGRIVQCFHTFSSDPFKTLENVEINLEEGSTAEFYILQNEHNKAEHRTAYKIRQAAGSNLKMVFISLHGGVIANDIHIDLCGERADCDISGLYLTDSKQLMDNTIDLNHLVGKCHSNQLFKGILDDEGVTRFAGRINVAPDAQKTEAYQANHNLLISDSARAYTKPQLEIYADDVKCSHGATVGRLNEDELFYMRTRGIPASEAKLLQQMAFAYEVLGRIGNNELRERMQSLVEKRLRGEFAHCRNCSKNCC